MLFMIFRRQSVMCGVDASAHGAWASTPTTRSQTQLRLAAIEYEPVLGKLAAPAAEATCVVSNNEAANYGDESNPPQKRNSKY